MVLLQKAGDICCPDNYKQVWINQVKWHKESQVQRAETIAKKQFCEQLNIIYLYDLL